MKLPRTTRAKVIALVLGYLALAALLVAAGADATSMGAVLATWIATAYAATRRSSSGSCWPFGRR